MAKLFTVGERFGPYPCEEEVNGKRCGQRCYSFWLSDAEILRLNEALPDHVLGGMAHGPEAIRYIHTKRLGKTVCPAHERASTS